MMVALGRQYVPYINAAYQRSGTLWEGRYKSILVQSEAYLLACMRYIIRLALNQTQPLGNSRFLDAIEQATGQRHEPKPRGRPRKPAGQGIAGDQLALQGLDT